GPWVNSRRRNFFTAIVIWVLVLLSLALTAATLFSNISSTALKAGFAAGAAIGLIGGATMMLVVRRSRRLELAGLPFEQRVGREQEELRLAADLGLAVVAPAGASARERRGAAKAAIERARNSFQMKPVEQLPRPVMSRQRFVGLVVLRSYLLIAFVLTVVKIAGIA
ncbi:MAG TPA: hypothetical protein VG010_07555, partial [Solirubrobacteraceae bacterium]|nr:hypothetical protein [Solirubrobacteraceae bacterium]